MTKPKSSSSRVGSSKAKAISHPPHQAAAAESPFPRAAAASRSRWKLIIIDQEPIRQSATQAYREAGARLAEIRAVVERFSTVDQPAYNHWMAGTFGALLTEMRDMETQIDAKDALLDTIEMLTLLGRFGPREAYEAAISGQTAAEKFAKERNGASAAPTDEENAEGDDFFDEEKAFDEMFGEFAKAFGFKMPPGGSKSQEAPPPGPGFDPLEDEPPNPPGHRGAPRSAGAARSAAQQTDNQRLKTAYRAVVRRLHPDLNPNVTGYGKQLWHDAQSAYEKGDLDRLESILAVSELELGGELPAGSGIGGVVELTRQLDRSVAQLERQVRGLKKSPAWNFGLMVSKKTLEQKTRTRLQKDVSHAKAELKMLETELEFYRNAPPRKARVPQKKQARKPAGRKKK